MAFAEYASYDGLGLAGLVRKGDVTPLELLDEAIARKKQSGAQRRCLQGL
jgi:amidase